MLYCPCNPEIPGYFLFPLLLGSHTNEALLHHHAVCPVFPQAKFLVEELHVCHQLVATSMFCCADMRGSCWSHSEFHIFGHASEELSCIDIHEFVVLMQGYILERHLSELQSCVCVGIRC